MELGIDFLDLIATSVVGIVTSGTAGYLVKFAREQKAVNLANAEANRSMQRDVLYRYFHKGVELGETLTPEEFEHVRSCWKAYEANGGNGAGKLMWERIEEHALIDTGRS